MTVVCFERDLSAFALRLPLNFFSLPESAIWPKSALLFDATRSHHRDGHSPLYASFLSSCSDCSLIKLTVLPCERSSSAMVEETTDFPELGCPHKMIKGMTQTDTLRFAKLDWQLDWQILKARAARRQPSRPSSFRASCTGLSLELIEACSVYSAGGSIVSRTRS